MKESKINPGKILLIGIGNCGRGDDGLGWNFADCISEAGYHYIDIEYRYQLQVEDAELIHRYDLVVFADATHDKKVNGFEIRRCEPSESFFYSSHMQSPEAVLFLSAELYGKAPIAYIVALSGHEWDIKTSLHGEAEKNLGSALVFFKNEFLPSVGNTQPRCTYAGIDTGTC